VDFARLLRAIQQEAATLSKEMPFEAYVDQVRKDRRLARLSHELIYDSIVDAGVSIDLRGQRHYDLWKDELFGADSAITQVVEYFAASARRLEVRKRILLLIGPPGCGKSTLVNTIKEGLEQYTRMPRGAVYAIKGCPIYEDPLHLIPPHRRKELRGIQIEGDLCPYCRWLVRTVYKGNIARVPVQRFTFSTADGIGIGTYVATDPGSEDLARLVGSVDAAALRGTLDRTAARTAFQLDGELNAANRGMADLVEILKMDERFLAVLLTVSQEQLVKLSGRGTLYADEALVAHSNIAEYESFVSEPKAAALLDRIVVVHMGYALSIRNEIRIYQKMLGPSGLGGASVSPLALPAAATFAVLTRLSPPRSGWTLRQKLRLYDGRFVPDMRPEDVKSFRAAPHEDGSTGFSPRYVVNQLARAATRAEGCLSGIVVLEMLWEGLSQRAGSSEEERQLASDMLNAARSEYDEMVKRTIRRAMVSGYDKAAATLANAVLKELKAWRANPDADVKRLSEVENALQLADGARADFRAEALDALSAGAAAGEAPLYSEHPGVEEAIERMMLPSWRDAARRLLGEEKGTEADKVQSQTRQRLVSEAGFDKACADDLVDYALTLAGGADRERRSPSWGRRGFRGA
jgi:serine protein kinase